MKTPVTAGATVIRGAVTAALRLPRQPVGDVLQKKRRTDTQGGGWESTHTHTHKRCALRKPTARRSLSVICKQTELISQNVLPVSREGFNLKDSQPILKQDHKRMYNQASKEKKCSLE